MAHYKAEVNLGTNSGYQTVEVNSSSIAGVTEQICRIYHVTPNQIRNIRQASNHTPSESSDSIEGYIALISLAGIAILFSMYTSYFLMLLFGSGSGWIATKFTKMNSRELFEDGTSKTFGIVLAISIASGGIGMVLGKHIQQNYIEPQVHPASSKTVH